MIYICEYDGGGEKGELLDFGEKLDFWRRQSGGQEREEGERRPHVPEAASLCGEPSGRRWEKLRQRLTAWRLLETAAQREWGIPGIEALQVARTERGKPYSLRYPELRFNLSHCGTACACVLSGQEAGIDVERPFPYRPSLAKKVCTGREWELLEAMGEREREEALRLLWSMKESYVKLDGRGLSYGMKKIELAPFLSERYEFHPDKSPAYARPADAPRESIRLPVIPGGPPLCFLTIQTARYTLAACGPALPDQVIRYRESQLWRKE